MLHVRPANELGTAVLIPVGFSRQRMLGNCSTIICCNPLACLSLHLWVSARSILVQQLIGCRIHPALVVGWEPIDRRGQS